MPGVLDIINSIAVFQLVFFTLFLFLRGNKVPSTFFLKLFLFSQLIPFYNYLFWRFENPYLRPLLLLSMPCMFCWAPTYYFYVRSRLFNKFKFSGDLLVHFIPAICQMSILMFVLIRGESLQELIRQIFHISYIFIQCQLLIYNLVTLFLIYKYQREIVNFTSSSELIKINWLLVITYGLTIASLIDFILFLLPELTDLGLGWLLFWAFIQLFFFKSLIQPDQFLGLDERKTLPLKISSQTGLKYFLDIEDVISSNKLFLEPDLSLHNIGVAVNLSDRMVSQSIKFKTGNNFSDYINRKRVDYAKDLLKSYTPSAKNILEILYESGFNSKSVFNSQFKRLTGLSPKEYRKQFSPKD